MTKDTDYVAFLQWALPRLGMRWPGFRKVRRQVEKRISRRLGELCLEGLAGYRAYLAEHEEEWMVLDEMCRITISRFYRDAGVFESLRNVVLPQLAAAAAAAGRQTVRSWSLGCASGEEPYGLVAAWLACAGVRFNDVKIEVVATDIDPDLVERACLGRYRKGSLSELPSAWIESMFERQGDLFVVRPHLSQYVSFSVQDVRLVRPEGRFDLILCRNIIFTYFDENSQTAILAEMLESLIPGGVLVVGIHEKLPPGVPGLSVWEGLRCIYRKIESS